MQGPVRLADYLVTRCVETVVHGCDLVDPVRPDRVAQAMTAGALLEALAARAPHLVWDARQLPLPVWTPGTPTWSSTAPYFPSTGWPPTGRSAPASTAGTG